MTGKKYRAVLSDSEPNAPGGGGCYSTLSYDQLPKTGWCTSREEALEKGKELNRGWNYDWFVTIEEGDGDIE